MIRASGPSGVLRVAYQVAARLGPWEIVVSRALPHPFEFRSTVIEAQAYWLPQRPLDLVWAIGQTEWIWRDGTAQSADAVVTIELTERPIVSDRAPVSARAS